MGTPAEQLIAEILTTNQGDRERTMSNGNTPEHNIKKKDFYRDVLTAIKNEEDIVFITYSAIDRTEEKLIFTLAKILERHNMVEIFTPVLSCIKELIANATKANAKKILIDEGTIINPDDSEEVVKKVREILNKDALLEYGIKAKQKKLSTRIYLKLKANNLLIEVINNLPLGVHELRRMTERIEQASHYDNIAEFYMENPDPEAEGMGLGISMIVVLLKNINISHKNFILDTDKKSKTYARILIPLSK